MKLHPGTVEAPTEPVKSETGAVEIPIEAVEICNRGMKAHNGATEAQTGAMKAHSPEPRILTLRLWKLTPGTMEANHEAIKAFPRAIKNRIF